jgi:TP901 family phage tail tape measure protein
MGKRGPSAQYAYGITIEAGNYNEVINGFEKRLKDLDKVTKTTTATFAALSEAMKSGKRVDFSKAEGQLTGLVAEMEEVAKWREQLAGGQKLSDMFDGLEQVKQSLGQVTGQLDKFGDNIEEIFSILQSVPQNTSKTFVDIRKVLSQTASDMNKIIAELNNPTEKTDVSGLKNQLSSLATDFVNEWNKAAAQGIKMDQVVDFKPFANIIKTAINGARSLGTEFNDVSASVTEATKNVVALYNVKHPTGMFKDLASGISNVGTQSKKTEQTVVKFSSAFKAAISIVDKFSKSDMGLSKKNKEMDEFLAKLKNPEITIDLKNKEVEEEFYKLADIYDDIVGANNITPEFLKNLPIDKLKELGSTLQNIIAMGKEFPEFINTDEDNEVSILDAYGSDLKKVIEGIKALLDEANAQIAESVKTLKSQLEALGLKDIELDVKLVDLTGDKVQEYVNQLNQFVDDLTGQLKNKGAIELPVNIQMPGITPDNADSKKAKDVISAAMDEYSEIAKDASKEATKNAKGKAMSKIISGAFGSNENLDLYLSYIKQQFSKIRETVRQQKKEIQDMLSLDFTWNKGEASNSFSNLFVELQDYFADPENAIKVEIDSTYLKDGIKNAFKDAGGIDLKLPSSGTPMDQSQLAAAIISAFRGTLPTGRQSSTPVTKQTTTSSSASPVTEADVKDRFVFNIKEFMSKYSGELSEGLNQTLENIVNSVRDVAKTANGSKVNQEVRAKIQAAFGSLDLSKVAEMTNEEIISWVQNALLKADESGRAIGADLPKALDNTKVSWKSVSNFTNALNQLFIKIENETRDVEQAANERNKVAILKDFGYRARAIDSKSAVVRKLGKGEVDTDFLKSQMERLQSVKAYKDSLGEEGSKIVKWLDSAIAIYQKLINISNGTTTFNTEAEKQEEITKLRDELSKIRVSDDKSLIETLSGEITVSKKYKNGTKSRGQRKGFTGSSRSLEKALSLIEKTGDDGVITIKFTSGPNDKAFKEWIESENEYGRTVNTLRRSKDNNLRGESKSSLISPREDRERLLDQKIDFKPFSQSRKPIDWDEYKNDLQRRLQENEEALAEQQKIVDEARKNLTSAKRAVSSSSKKVYSGSGDINDEWIAKEEDILKLATEDKNSGLNDKSIKQLSKLVKSSYSKDSKSFKKAYATAQKDLESLMSKEATEDNIAQVKSLLDFINSLNRAAENYTSAAKYVDEKFVINEEIDKSLFESASKRVSDAGEIKVKSKKYKGTGLPQTNVSKLVSGIKRKESIEEFSSYSSAYQEHIKSLLDSALTDLKETMQGKDTSANRKKIQSILQYIDNLKRQFDQFKEIEQKIYEAYNFGKTKKDVKFENLSSVDNIIENYKTGKEVLQRKIEEIDQQLAYLDQQKGNIKHYTDEQKAIAKLQLDASNYYSGISKVKQLEYNFNNAQTEQEKEKFAQLLQSAKSQNANDASKNIGNVIKFIEELESKLSDKNISEQDRNTLSSVLQEAQSLFKELNVANVTGKTPLFQMSQSRYEDIIADNSAEAERIAEAEKKALARRAKVVEKLNDFEANSPGAEALRRASSVKSGESYRSKSISTQIDKTNAQSVFNESEEKLRVLEKEKEALQAEKEKVAEKKKYNNLLIQEKKLKEEIAAADKAGVSSEEKKIELTKLQEKIAKQEKKLGINFEEVSPSMTKEKAFDKASEYDAQEKLLRSQVKALESKVESAQELINSLTARGFNSAKGEAELRRFTNDRVADFRSSDYFRTKKDEIRDKYLKGVYKEDGTLDSSDSLEGKIRELADKYSKDIDKIFFNIADVKEGNAQEFLSGLIGDQTRFSNAFKGNNDVGQKFMADYEEFKSFYWELIKEEESKVVDDYKKSIKVDKHNGTVSYTSYDGDTIQEVVVDLKSQIIQGLKEQIEAELMPTLSEKTGLLGRVSDSKKQALDFAGLKESDIRNIDVDSKIASLKSDIEGLKSTNISAKDRDIEGAKQRDLERQKSIIEEIESVNSRITYNEIDQIKLVRELNAEKENYLKSINKDGSKSDAGKIAIERLKTNATAEYVNSDAYKSQVEAINNKYYGKGENGKSLFDESIDKIVPKYKDAIYRILSNTSKYTEEEIDGFLKLIQDNPELYSSSDAYFKLGKTKNAEMAKTLSDNSERVWSNLVREYSSIKGFVEDGIERDIKALIKNYRDSFEINNDNNTVSYTSYVNGKAENVVRNLKETLLSVIKQEIADILSGKNIDSIVNDVVGSKAKDLYSKRNSATYLQKQLKELDAQKQVIESRIASGALSEEDQKEVDKQLKEKKAIEDKIAVLEKEIEAWEFVKKAREEARELDKKTDQEREATELSKIERYEQSITEKKEKQRQLQEELNLLRGEEVKDVDTIERKESELEEVTKKITELEGKKQKSEGSLGRIRERIENAPVVSEASSSGGGILSPIVNLLTEIRDILSRISGVSVKSGESGKSGSAPNSGEKTKSEINSMLSKYWYKKNGKSATQEEWKQLKQDYVDGKLTDLDEVLAQEVQAKIEKEKKEDTKPVAKKNDTKKSDDRFSNILRLAGFRDENNKAIQLASKSTDEFLSDAQALYDDVKNWSGDKTSDEYLAKQLSLGKTLTALRSSLPRTYSGKNGYTNAEEWANYLSENGLSGAMESSIKNQKNLKAVIENGVTVVAEEVVEQGVEEGKNVAEEPKQESTSKKQKYAGGLTWSKAKDAIKNGANKPEDGLSLEEYITKAQSLYNEINSWVGEKNIEYFSKRLELGSVMQKAAVAVKQANPDKKFKNTDLYNYFAKQYNMENVNSLALTAKRLDGNKEIMEALADVKPVDTTPVTQSVENTDNAVVEHVAETAKTVEEEVRQTAEQQKQVELSNAEKLKLAKKELQKRLDAAKSIQDGTTLKSNKVIVTHSDESKKGVKYSLDENIESIDEFAEGVWKLTEAFKDGADAANIEYGFATQNGKRIQLAKGDNDSVNFTRFHGDIDSLTHSHSYTKGVNNMVFSLADIDQLETLGTRNNLKRYNLIYDNEMMSLNLGKNSQEAAEAIADCYPQINDVVMAMLSREDGNSIPAENTEEMARILNGYLQKVVEDAGGRLSVVNSKGENVTSKYSITDDEYNKFNNVLAKFQSYYDNNFGSVSKSDHVSVIRQYLSEEFGKEFMANITSKSNANPHGGLYTEFSAIPEYDDEDKKMLDYAEQVTLYSKKIVAAEKAFVESLQKMSNEDLMSFINQAEETLGVKKEPEVKPTLTKAQIAALNPDDVTALQKASIKQFSKVRNWNENNVGNIEGFLGADNKTLVAYKTQFEELAKIALDLKAKGESGTIITKDDISQLDIAISKTKELQTALTKEAQFKQMKDAGLIVSGKTKIKSTDSYSERQDIMAQYAKKYAAQNKSEYQFGQYDFINDKISFNMIDSAGQVTKVIMGWSDAFNTAYIQSSKLQGSLDKITQEVYKTDEAIKAGEEYGFFQEQSEGVKAYKDALAEYEAQVKAVAKSSQKDLAQNFEELHTAQEKAINAGRDLLDKQKDAYGFNNAQKVLGRTGDVDAVLQNYRDQGINVNDIELVRNYNDAMGDLNKKIEELKKNGKLWDANEQPGLKLLADRAIEAEKALLKADEAQRQLNGEVIKGKNAKFFEGINPNNVDQVKQAMEQYARSINGVDAQSIKWSEDQKTLSYSVRTGKREVSDFTIGVKELTNEFYEARTGTRAVKTGMEEFLGSIGDKFKEVGRYLLSFGSFYRVWGEIQKGVTYVREIDSALTELKKVTDETDETYAQFLNTMSQTGAEVGATVKDLTNMAANWARLGYSIQEAGELAKSTAVLLNVSEFTDADTASKALISTMQAYGYAAEDSMHVVDVLNEIGNNFAISSDGIATALQDSASSLMAAGNNLEQSVAMIAAANKVLQDPNSVGSALRTISLRIRGTSVKVLEEMGEETDGVIESVSKLQAKVKGLSGVDILTDTGAYKDTYTIIKEIGQVWEQMNDINRAALLELLAGKNRSNAMAALLTNMEDLEGAYEDAMAAQGSAEAENEKYMNSIQGRIDQFNNALQTMWSSELDSGFVKFIVSAGTALVKFIDTIGLLPSILTMIGAIKLGKIFLPKMWTSLTIAVTTHIAALSGETAAIEALNGAKVKAAIMDSTSISNDVKEIAIKTLLTGEIGNETVVTDLNTVSKIKAALAQQGLNDAQISGVLSAMGLTTANVGLGTSFKLLAANIWKSIKAILVYIATNPWTWVAIGATAAIIVIAKLTKTHQEYVKELKETSDEISDVKSNLSSLEDELKSVSDRIDELNSKDKLSFTEKEELKNLKAQNAELERSIRIEEQKEKRLQKKAAKNLNDAVKTDYSINGKSTVYKDSDGNYVSQTVAVDQSANNYAPGNEKLNDGYSKETVSSIQAKIIEYERTQKELEEAKDELEKLGDEAEDKEVKNAQAKVDRLQRSADSAYDAISNTMDKFNEDYLSQDGVEWQYGNPDELEDWQKQMNANLKIIYDAQDKLAIGADNTGKAIKSAFSRVTLQTEFRDELKEIQDTAGITGEKLKEMYEADNSTDNTGMKALIQSLMDCGVIANASAEELQKVVDLSLELGDSASDAATANKKLARSQKMLQYSRLYKELHKYTDALRDGRKRSGELFAQDKKSVQAIREKMAALSEEISKYDILGDQMNEAKEAFTDFENAKKSSEENPEYIDTAGEMFQAVIDGFHSAEMGSETFKAAFKGLIPESVYKDLDTLEERYTAAGEYVKNTLSRYFKIEYDDDGAVKSVETTTKNIETFIEDAKEKGLMSFSDGVWTVEETDFKKFADKMGITESMLVAIGTQMDNIDADWIMGDNSSFFDSFDMGTEANIYKTTKALTDLDQQFIDGKISVDEYTQKYQELQDKLSENKENAINDIINYDNATKKVDELQNSLKAATDKLNELKNNPEATEDQIAEAAKNANEIATNLQTALQNKSALEKPSQVLVEFAVANIEDEKAKIVAELGTIDASIKLTTTDKDGKEQINSSIIKQLDDGTYEINVDANLTEESKAKVQSYVDLLNKEAQINSYVEGDQGAKESADDLKKTYEDLSQVIKDLPSPKINTSLAQSAVNTLKKTVDNLKDSFDDLPTEVTTTVTTVNRTVNETVERKSTGFGWIDKILGLNFDGNAHFDGAANASGTLGAEKTETSLVGELGPELRVRGNRWEMLGENGTEFADVQKGDIIFNHKQTEELLKNGHISSRGKAFVGGTAYAGTSGTIFTKYATEKDYGGKVPDWYGHADLLYDAANSVSDAADDISDAADDFEEVFDWFEVLLEEIEDNISLMNAKLENTVGISAKKGIYSEILNTEQFKLQELYEGIKLYSDYANKLLAKVPDQYKEMAKNGAVAITDFLGEANEEVVDSINNYREWAKKVSDLNQQLEETKTKISDTHVEIQNMLKDEYDNRISLITSVNDRIQGTIDLLDEEGKRSSAVMYEEMIKNSTKQLSELQSKRAEMQRALDEAVRSGDVARESTQWYEMVNAINDVDSEINDCRIDLEGFQNSINQLHWDNFEKFIDAIDNVGNEISNLGDLIDEEDVVDEVGNWTDKGITALGLYAQEMERAKYRAGQYGKEIEYLNQEYAAGKYSVDEYNEKLQELKDGQWDSIKSYEAAKKSIIDLNKTRVEAIKDGIQKEIDAYSELIDKKKEELSLQKDAHDFSKQVTEQQKNIANIQKQLAAMAGDNSASAIARRKQLEAELAAAQEELDELYYNHSVEKQQEALDKSLENYQDDKQNEMDALDESLKNEEQIIADSYATITANTESVAQTLSDIASQYGITLSDSVMQPWLDGANAIGTYQEQLDTSMSSFTQQLEALKQMYADLQNQADSAGRSMVDAINGNKSKTEGATYTPPTPSQPSTPSKPSKPSAPSTGSSVTVKKSATRFSRDGGNGTRMQSWVPGSTFTVYQVSDSEVLIGRNGQYTGWVRLSDIEGYAKGTKEIQNNQLAMLDELGDELVLHAGKNGRLEYLTKGTSVVPADITSNLMKLGSLDPKDILERNRPSIGAPHVIDNSIELKMEFGSLVHVDTVSNDTLPYLQKMVRNEFDNCMKHVNQGLKKFVR